MVRPASQPVARAQVLVVDDDEGMRDLIVASLRPLGLATETADNGAVALDLLAARSFDLVVSDLTMPTVDGNELLEMMRARGDATPVLFLSAEGTVPAVVRLMKRGACGFIQKPVAPSDLKREVLSALRTSQERSAEATARWRRAPASAPPRRGENDTDQLGGLRRDDTIADWEGEPAGFAPGELTGRVGRYLLGAEMASGGMGRVHRGYDPTLGRSVAVKLLTPPATASLRDELLARFRSEGVALAKLQHPNIVGLFDCGFDEQSGLPYLVMELVEARSLGSTLASHGPLELEAALRVAVQVAGALSYAHARGVVHRDVKPDNVLVGEDDHAWLIEFGLARLAHTRHTAARMLVGTPSYVAPETVSGAELDWRADQFSLATLVVEMLTGKNVFRGDSVTETLGLVAFHAVPSLADLGLCDAPPALQRALRRMHAKSPALRFQDERELQEALLDVLGSLSGGGSRPTPSPR